MRYKSIYFVTTESIKNLGNFRNYLIENTQYLVTFHFPHGYLQKSSYVEIFIGGKLAYRANFYRYHGKNSILKLLLYYLYFNYVLFRFVKRGSFIIVENPIFCILNSIVAFIKRVKFIFWVGDYFPQHAGFMWFYNKIADFYIKRLRYVIYISPPIDRIYSIMFGKKSFKNKFRKQISLGIVKKFTKVNKIINDNKSITIGFIGVIREQQGLDLIFKFLSSNSINCRLEIVGDGYKANHYKELAKKLGILGKVKFYGFVENAEPILKKCDIGLALYENTSDNVSKYCEPVKIKDYLEYGLPVITTKTTYMHKEIEKFHAGEVIDENVGSLKKAIDKIAKNYSLYEDGINQILNKYEYKKWYTKSFSFLE